MAERAEEGGDGAEADLGFRDPCLVVWDVESCPLSKDLKVEEIFPRIRRRLSGWGYLGPVQMLAIGGYRACARYKLSDTGILMCYVSCGKRSGIPVLSGMSSWIENNLAPANILLIAGDRSYPGAVELLHQLNYNMLQRQQECMCPGKKNHYNYCWGWSELFDGEWPPQGNLKRSRDNDGPSPLGEPIERRDGPDAAASSLVISPCC